MGERARAQVLARRRTGRESHSGLLFSINSLPGLGGSIPHVGGEDNDVEVLVDVVHNLVAGLGLGDVLPELLDASATGLLGTVEVNDLVSIVLGINTPVIVNDQ